MDFPALIDSHESKDVLGEWYNRLRSSAEPKCKKLLEQMNEDVLFGRSADAYSRLSAFGRHLSSTSDPVTDSQAALGTAAGAGESCLVCAGPSAELPPPPEVRHVAPLMGLIHHRYFRADALPTQDATELAESITDDLTFKEYLRPGVRFRGAVPNMFWASQEDLSTLEASLNRPITMTDIRKYLGIDRQPFLTPGIMIRLADPAAIPTHVPTCFDAHGHPHFVAATTEAVAPDPKYGRALDLVSGALGAREVVTHPQPPESVQYVRVIEGDRSTHHGG